MTTTRALKLRLPNELFDALVARSEASGLTVSQVARLAIVKGLDEVQP